MDLTEVSEIDLDQLLTNVESNDPWDWTSSDEVAIEAFMDVRGKGTTGVKKLKEVDYSLNSPLIADELEKFIRGVKNGIIPTDFVGRVRYMFFLYIETLRPNKFELKEVASYHQWMGKLFLRTASLDATLCQDFEKIYKQTLKDHEETSIFIKLYKKGAAKKETHGPDYAACHPDVKRWGALFLELHWFTYLLNSSDVKEMYYARQHLRSAVSYECTTERGPEYLTAAKSLLFGEVFLGLGFVFMPDEEIILDRNFLLMLKDTAAARCHTLLAVSCRMDDELGLEASRVIQEIYDHGDNALYESGNSSYEGFSLLEPMCNDKVCDLARENKGGRDEEHLVPEDTRFKEHINEALSEVPSQRRFRAIQEKISSLTCVLLVLNIFGSFRHWGHPFIDHIKGVKELASRVLKKRTVNHIVANQLGSDLAFKVLTRHFNKKRRWAVHWNLLDLTHPLREAFASHKYPTKSAIDAFGDNWHLLELKKVFDTPDMIDNSAIYSDKSHSLNRKELIALYAGGKKPNSIPTKRVLNTLLEKDTRDWKAFFEMIDQFGLPKDSLVIGLRAKERELKLLGRYFALMAWDLREYFVSTEYLIKKHYVPMFEGLTMADDMTTVTKKLLDCTVNHGRPDYGQICFSNHIDYSKWNNYQSKEANEHVFRVMGAFLGYKNLISQTHDFFKDSLVYYLGAPELLDVQDGELISANPEDQLTWTGQLGGLEGLRQKGWSITNYLAIERAQRSVTTARVKVLAQGDNQIICTTFNTKTVRGRAELEREINKITTLNSNLMNEIQRITTGLGLKLNPDETLVSTEYLIYGKIPVFKGNIMPIDSKRWSRVTCSTNDQLPNLANVMSTVTSCALTVSQNSLVVTNCMYHMDFVGNLVRILIEMHNPALGGPHSAFVKELEDPVERRSQKAFILYADPSIGGICGTSLNRFMIRGFPDPVTESLSFLKIVHDNTDEEWVKNLCIAIGNPSIALFKSDRFSKLLENPVGLSLSRGVNPSAIIKTAVIKALRDDKETIKNEMIKLAITLNEAGEEQFIEFLTTITPWFPRFFAEIKSACVYGIADSCIGLIANSKTIRNMTKHKMGDTVDVALHKAEVRNVVATQFALRGHKGQEMWPCSSTKADNLRSQCYLTTLAGTTIPHVSEMFSAPEKCFTSTCKRCLTEPAHLVVHIPNGLCNLWNERGPLPAYLGSRTSDSTALAAHWEKETKVPFIRRILKLYGGVDWIYNLTGSLAKTIENIMYSITGRRIPLTKGAKRTGCPIHRFSSDRQSNGGFSAQSSACLTRMYASTDMMMILDQNYDFTFQSALVYSQAISSIVHLHDPSYATYHFHIGCLECIRIIQDDLKLECETPFEFPLISDVLEKLKPDGVEWITMIPDPELEEVDWKSLSDKVRSYHVGRACGLLFANMINCKDLVKRQNIFPNVVAKKVQTSSFFDGLIDGIGRSTALYMLSRMITYKAEHHETKNVLLISQILDILKHLYQDASFNIFVLGGDHMPVLIQGGCEMPRSYPTDQEAISKMCGPYLTERVLSLFKDRYSTPYPECLIFPELRTPERIAEISLGGYALTYFFQLSHRFKRSVYLLNTYSLILEDPSVPLSSVCTKYCFSVDQEIRHALRDGYIFQEPMITNDSDWGTELIVPAFGSALRTSLVPQDPNCPVIQRIMDPTVSGCREFRMTTGSHVKVKSILTYLDIKEENFIIGGDGSGGITSMVIRMTTTKKVLFNSLIEYEGVNLKGSLPPPPPAVAILGSISRKCQNLRNCWANPGNLADERTWFTLGDQAWEADMSNCVLILDMECRTYEEYFLIFKRMNWAIKNRVVPVKRVLVKCFLSLIAERPALLEEISKHFGHVEVTWSHITSSNSSEVYIHGGGFSNTPIERFIDWRFFWDSLSHHPCFQDHIVEFHRAVSLRHLDFFKGVPDRFRSSPQQELFSYMLSMDVSAHHALELRDFIRINSKARTTGPAYVILQRMTDSLICTSGTSFKPPSPPTDTTVLRVLAAHFGFWFWAAYTSHDRPLHENLRTAFNNKMHFSWERRSGRVVTEAGVVQGFHQRWEFNNENSIIKNHYMDSMAGQVSNWFRLFKMSFRCATHVHMPESEVKLLPEKMDKSKYLLGQKRGGSLLDGKYSKGGDREDTLEGQRASVDEGAYQI